MHFVNECPHNGKTNVGECYCVHKARLCKVCCAFLKDFGL